MGAGALISLFPPVYNPWWRWNEKMCCDHTSDATAHYNYKHGMEPCAVTTKLRSVKQRETGVKRAWTPILGRERLF